tara:strand:+ start:284 stop:556 length:273 start_codon:yes stop_codon:yes gene_type:complete
MPNQTIFDPYSICHAGGGVVARSIKLSLFQTLVLHTIFEIVENKYLKFHPKVKEIFPDPSPDTLLNSIGDTISAALGWYLTDQYGGVSAL